MADDLRANLDELGPLGRQEPVFHSLGQGQSSLEVAEVAGQGMQL
jgi:hypothetical protein